MKKIVVFDFDKTISEIDTIIGYFIYVTPFNITFPFRISYYIIFTLLAKIGLISNHYLKQLGINLFLNNLTLDHIHKKSKEYANTIKLNHLVKDRLYNYLSKPEYHVIIISASFTIYLKHLFEGISILGSEIHENMNRYKLTYNCYKEKKVELLAAKKIKNIDELYTDSISDLPLVLISKKIFLVKKEKIILCKNRDDFIIKVKN